MATAPTPLPTPSTVSRGFGLLRCPKCSTPASITVDLEDMNVLTCRSCEDEFNLDDVREMIEQANAWLRVLSFIDTAPTVEEE